MDLFAEPTLGADAEAIAHDQHAYEQLRVDRGTAGTAVERGQMLTDAGQIDEAIDGSQQVILGDVILYRDLVKQSALRLLLRSQHRRSPASLPRVNQRPSPKSTRVFQRNTPNAAGDLAWPGPKRTVGTDGSMRIDCLTMTTDAAAPMSHCARTGEGLTQPLESGVHKKTRLGALPKLWSMIRRHRRALGRSGPILGLPAPPNPTSQPNPTDGIYGGTDQRRGRSSI